MFDNWLFKVLLATAVIFLETRARCETPPRERRDTASPTHDEILKAYFEGKRLLIPGNPDPTQLHEIDQSDPAYKIVMEYVETTKTRWQDPARSIDYCKELKGPAARRLFPDYRFFVCQWHEGSAYFIDALALNKDRHLTSIGPLNRHDQDFGEFLAEHKIKITDEKNARLVWDAYREIRRRHGTTDTIEKVSDRLWRLGVKDGRHKGLGKAYYEVRLNDDLTVKSAEWTIESPQRSPEGGEQR